METNCKYVLEENQVTTNTVSNEYNNHKIKH